MKTYSWVSYSISSKFALFKTAESFKLQLEMTWKFLAKVEKNKISSQKCFQTTVCFILLI